MRIPGLARTGSGSRRRRGILAAVVCLACVSEAALAQVGPIDATGYVEYQMLRQDGDGGRSFTSNRLLAHTDWSTFVWRPWILGVTGSLSATAGQADESSGPSRADRVFGSLKLNFVPRSSFPLTLFYDRSDYGTNRQIDSTANDVERFGLLQQFSTKRLGSYSFRWENLATTSLYLNGVDILDQKDVRTWQFRGLKALGKNRLQLNSQGLRLDQTLLPPERQILRHNFEHTFRPSAKLDVRNSFFYGDEQSFSNAMRNGREYRQLSSIVTWRPALVRPLLITGRGYVQDARHFSGLDESNSQHFAFSGAANYELSERLRLNGSVGVTAAESEGGQSDTAVQQLGLAYRSLDIRVMEGGYRYYAQAFIANRNESGNGMEMSEQILGSTLGHSFSRAVASSAPGSRWMFQVAQNVSTRHDTNGQERNSLQHTVSVTNQAGAGDVTRYLRLSLSDRRSYADEGTEYQLASLQYSLQGRLSNRRSWTANGAVQYGRTGGDARINRGGGNENFSYSVSAGYRDSRFFNVNNLRFTSDLQWRSAAYRSDDVLNVDAIIDRDRVDSYWRNRLEYRLGLLQLNANANIFDNDGALSASCFLSIRRYFGMR